MIAGGYSNECSYTKELSLHAEADVYINAWCHTHCTMFQQTKKDGCWKHPHSPCYIAAVSIAARLP